MTTSRRRLLRPSRCLLVCVSLLPNPLSAQALDGWRLSSADVTALALPATVHRQDLDLEYDIDGPPVQGREVDLNDDGRADFLVRSATTLCGATGSCPFAIVEGATGRVVGTVMGSIIVIRRQHVNGSAVLHTWSSTSADAGEFVRYEFDGRAYRRRAAAIHSGSAQDALKNEMRRLPELPRVR